MSTMHLSNLEIAFLFLKNGCRREKVLVFAQGSNFGHFLSAPKRVQYSGRHVISGPRFEFPCIRIGFEAGMGRGGCCAWFVGEVFGYEVERHRVHWHRFGHPALLSGILRRVLWHRCGGLAVWEGRVIFRFHTLPYGAVLVPNKKRSMYETKVILPPLTQTF
jgi:hypothetical protein